uniref:Interferon a3-like n=1 Tax=Salarias fasciatus TaxID=181472 RepID=A0A672GYD2_SALFA
MLRMIFSACLLLCVLGAASSLSCGWLGQKFTQHSETSFMLLDSMGRAEDAGPEDAHPPFPYNLYEQASSVSDEDKLAVAVQVLREVFALFEEDYSAASWEESTVDNFLNVVNTQADELSSCVSHRTRITRKMHVYFKRLSHHVLQHRSHSVAAWELVRNQIKLHLIRVHQLVSSVPSAL